MVDDTEVYELARRSATPARSWQLAVELADIAIWRYDLRSDRMHVLRPRLRHAGHPAAA